MTGRDFETGFRYLAYETVCHKFGTIATNAQVGALDATNCIPAGSHCSSDLFPGEPHVTAMVRCRNIPVEMSVEEWSA